MLMPTGPIAVWVIEKKGIRASLITGLIISTIGLWVRTQINQGFLWLMIGQFIVSISQSFIMMLSTKLSANWFPKKERVVSTMFA